MVIITKFCLINWIEQSTYRKLSNRLTPSWLSSCRSVREFMVAHLVDFPLCSAVQHSHVHGNGSLTMTMSTFEKMSFKVIHCAFLRLTLQQLIHLPLHVSIRSKRWLVILTSPSRLGDTSLSSMNSFLSTIVGLTELISFIMTRPNPTCNVDINAKICMSRTIFFPLSNSVQNSVRRLHSVPTQTFSVRKVGKNERGLSVDKHKIDR